MNQCNFIGRIGSDLELKETNKGKKVLNFQIADKEKNHTEWIRLVAWEKTAELIHQFCKKGERIYVSAKARTTKYTDKNNEEKYKTEFIVNTFEALGVTPNSNNHTQSEDETHHLSSSTFNSDNIPF